MQQEHGLAMLLTSLMDNVIWQVSVHWLQWLLLQGDLLLLWSGSNTIAAKVQSTAEKVISETELQLPKTEELFLWYVK